MLRCLCAAVLFGASTPVAGRLLDDTHPLTIAGLCYLGAALAMGVPVCRHGVAHGAVARSGRLLGVSVLFGGLLGPALLMTALATLPSASVSLLLNGELVATVLVASVVFREQLGARVLTATGVIAVASTLLTFRPDTSFEPAALLVVAACVCWGVDNAATARIDAIPATHVVAVKGAVAGSLNLLAGLAADQPPSLAVVPVALVVGAVGYGASILLWIEGARALGAARAQLVFSLAPFAGAVLAWVALREPASSRQLTALVLAAAGVWLVVGSAHDHRHRHGVVVHDHVHDHDEHHDRVHGHEHGDVGRHRHLHRHAPFEHSHLHAPDLHHTHEHPPRPTDGAMPEQSR